MEKNLFDFIHRNFLFYFIQHIFSLLCLHAVTERSIYDVYAKWNLPLWKTFFDRTDLSFCDVLVGFCMIRIEGFIGNHLLCECDWNRKLHFSFVVCSRPPLTFDYCTFSQFQLYQWLIIPMAMDKCIVAKCPKSVAHTIARSSSSLQHWDPHILM